MIKFPEVARYLLSVNGEILMPHKLIHAMNTLSKLN